jgi:glutamate synthase domain-containing protein 1
MITANLVQISDMLADSHSILNRWKNHSCQLLNAHEFKHIRQTEIDTADMLLPKPSSVQAEMTNEKLKIINYHAWFSQAVNEYV